MDYKQRSRLRLLAAALFAACCFVVSSASAELAAAKQDVKEIMGLDGISWETPHEYNGANLAVVGPDGFRMEIAFKAGEPLFLDFAKVADKAGPDGRFKYELVFTPKVSARDKALAAEARALGEDIGFVAASAPPTRTGGFTLSGGHPVDIDLPETTLKDFVIADDLIVDGSACIGFDCVNGESFGFDTLRLKENNLRIRFFDTSTSASFPTRDWEITVNDSSNGGAEKFSITDIDGGRIPFTIEAGAPSNSLFVDDGGRIGLGTGVPVVEVHIVDGDTPTLRLQQDGSSGFTPQTWDVAGNETNFFVRDVTNGSLLSLRIRPQAPSNSIFVNTNGDIGMGTSSPASSLHISKSTDTKVSMTNTGATGGSKTWEFVVRNAEGDFAFNETVSAGADFIFRSGGRISLPSVAAPASDGRAQIFVDSADGDLKVRFANGTLATIATD